MRKLATVLAIGGFTAVMVCGRAHAYGRPDLSGVEFGSHRYVVRPLAHHLAQGELRHAQKMQPWAWSRHRRGAGNLIAHSGASASVSATALPHFQCLCRKLEGAGYRIDFMGGYAARPYNPSAHPTGNALDINQVSFGRVTRRFPAGTDAMARSCGLTPGSTFGDTGHFEMPRKYGYVFPSGWGWRYASRWQRRYAMNARHRSWRHRRYAHA